MNSVASLYLDPCMHFIALSETNLGSTEAN
jgi:hypothetical protein